MTKLEDLSEKEQRFIEASAFIINSTKPLFTEKEVAGMLRAFCSINMLLLPEEGLLKYANDLQFLLWQDKSNCMEKYIEIFKPVSQI